MTDRDDDDEKYCDYDDYKTEVGEYFTEADDGQDLVDLIADGHSIFASS